MDNVLLVAYLLIVLAMIGVILVQRSEGGGLGIGGNNSFMTARGSANVLTRTTGILAALFFVFAIALTVMKGVDPGSTSILDSAAQSQTTDGTTAPASDNVLDALNQLQQQTSGEPVSGGATTGTDTTGTDTTGDSPALAIPEAPASGENGGN
ncbi:MAG: preprotein translocase subunit SecG [Alphaproteobacteria bacterium]|nr:preprotein translocase subunit SecG [Alphaproteobacteria bacterium]